MADRQRTELLKKYRRRAAMGLGFTDKEVTFIFDELDSVKTDRDELQRSFDLRWEADMRAIKLWRKQDPKGRAFSWPDHADLVVWLMKKLKERKK